MSIPETIRDQIGREALFLMGAYASISSGNTLSFRIKGSKKINLIQITLEPSDTYKIEFFKGTPKRRSKAKLISIHSDVYVDQLHNIIEKETGLFLSFHPRQYA